MVRSWNSVLMLGSQLVSGRYWYSELCGCVFSGKAEQCSSCWGTTSPCVHPLAEYGPAWLRCLCWYSHLTQSGEGHAILNRHFGASHRNAWRLIQALSAQTVSWLHTRHCKHKLCNLNSSYCAWPNKSRCAAMCATFRFHRAPLHSLQT